MSKNKQFLTLVGSCALALVVGISAMSLTPSFQSSNAQLEKLQSVSLQEQGSQSEQFSVKFSDIGDYGKEAGSYVVYHKGEMVGKITTGNGRTSTESNLTGEKLLSIYNDLVAQGGSNLTQYSKTSDSAVGDAGAVRIKSDIRQPGSEEAQALKDIEILLHTSSIALDTPGHNFIGGAGALRNKIQQVRQSSQNQRVRGAVIG